MNLLRDILLLLLLLPFVAGAASFDRYKVILTRKPFAPAVDPDAVVAETAVTVTKPPAFVKDLRMCAITESPAGTKAGFLNVRKKPMDVYYLYVGDSSQDGITLVEADYDKGAVLLRKGGEQYWLYMGGGSGNSSPGNAPAKSVHKGPGSARTSGSLNSYAERRRKRLEEMRRRAEAERKRSDEEIDKKLQEYQMERIRRGLTPLPIKLSPEADAELVKEGLLPPIEE